MPVGKVFFGSSAYLIDMSSTYYSFSTLVCVPTSKAQEVGLQLGAQAGQARLTRVLEQAGFTNVRRASANAANMVLEVRA